MRLNDTDLSRGQLALLGGGVAAILVGLGLGANRIRKRLAWRRATRNAPVLVRDMVVAKHTEPDLTDLPAEDAPRH